MLLNTDKTGPFSLKSFQFEIVLNCSVTPALCSVGSDSCSAIRSCAGFWTPAAPRLSTRAAGRRPKTCTGHEVAGSWAAVGRRALWGFQVRAAFDGGATLRRRDLHAFTRRRARGRKKRPELILKGVNGRRAH